MSTYREIHGKAVKSVSTDPSATTDAGQIWYNTSSDTYKTIVNLETFTSIAPVITGRFSSAGAGTQTAALIAGGYDTAATTASEEYNGSGWAVGGTLNQARYYIGGAGTQTSAVAMSGRHPPAGWALANTEEYNGTSWTNTTASPTALNQVTTTGTQTAALLWGGVASPGGSHASTTFELSSESWTAGGSLPAGLKVAGAFGTQTAAMSAGNEDGSTLYYNGSSWSDQSATVPYSGPDYWNYAGTSGTQTAGILMGGGPGAVTTTAKWDGSTWSSNPAMAIARLTGPMGPIGTSTAGLIASGAAPGPVYTTGVEEYNSSANIITPTAWAAGENLGTGRYGAGIGQSQTAATLAGLEQASPNAAIGNTENYDGTSWTEQTAMSNVHYRRSGCGTQTAGLGMAGYAGDSPGYKSSVEEYNGSSWTGGGSLPGGCQFGSANGPQTAAIYCMYNTPGGDSAEGLDYNGTAWTAGDNMVTARRQGSLIGASATQTAAIAAGGNVSPPSPSPNVKTTESYNGSSWTTVNSMNVGGHAAGSAGVQGNADIFGRAPTTGYPQVTTENYNGTTWTTRANAATARVAVHNGGGGTGAAIFMGGNPGSNSTEEFTDASTALNVKTLTQS